MCCYGFCAFNNIVAVEIKDILMDIDIEIVLGDEENTKQEPDALDDDEYDNKRGSDVVPVMLYLFCESIANCTNPDIASWTLIWKLILLVSRGSIVLIVSPLFGLKFLQLALFLNWCGVGSGLPEKMSFR
ncbi:hypothetical protein BDA99DRAFT_539624 [Phascolomyces articulosus]|uniref:Uncharacterized protein n=1 Tax=Phascolomyces articulosus TaxID=60185 RepID=A0AAD5JVQ4_9FUNG|nr:hypothetical protein BDA99DRAFT_539624 [Phascolomyces articulosus]